MPKNSGSNLKVPAISRFLVESLTPKRGPSPSFGSPHMLLALLLIGDVGMIGRQALARQLNLGEGAARTVVRRLKESGLVETDASGCHLTGNGRRLYDEARRKFSTFASASSGKLTIGEFQTALTVRGKGSAVRSGIEQRDSAIRLGAAGATTYSYRGGRFSIPGGTTDCERDFPSPTWSELRDALRPENGDAIVLCGAKDETTAKLGALAAASTLL